jgi:hypothetical protein
LGFSFGWGNSWLVGSFNFSFDSGELAGLLFKKCFNKYRGLKMLLFYSYLKKGAIFWKWIETKQNWKCLSWGYGDVTVSLCLFILLIFAAFFMTFDRVYEHESRISRVGDDGFEVLDIFWERPLLAIFKNLRETDSYQNSVKMCKSTLQSRYPLCWHSKKSLEFSFI